MLYPPIRTEHAPTPQSRTDPPATVVGNAPRAGNQTDRHTTRPETPVTGRTIDPTARRSTDRSGPAASTCGSPRRPTHRRRPDRGHHNLRQLLHVPGVQPTHRDPD